MRKAAVIALAVLILPSLAYGQAKVGTAGAQFLEIGVSARSIALGDAVIANIDDASALYYNPAAIAEFDRYKAMFTHIQYVADINYEFAAIIKHLNGNIAYEVPGINPRIVNFIDKGIEGILKDFQEVPAKYHACIIGWE